jgi:hypothetical protein
MTDQELAEGLGGYTRRLVEHDVLSGAVLVARRGRPVFMQAFGMAQRDPPTPSRLDAGIPEQALYRPGHRAAGGARAPRIRHPDVQRTP